MVAKTLDVNVINNAIGLYGTKSGRIVIDQEFGEMATWIKCTTAGTIVWYNKKTDELGVWELEAGEAWPIAYTEIRTNGIVHGIPETTNAGGLLWMTTGTDIGRPQ